MAKVRYSGTGQGMKKALLSLNFIMSVLNLSTIEVGWFQPVSNGSSIVGLCFLLKTLIFLLVSTICL